MNRALFRSAGLILVSFFLLAATASRAAEGGGIALGVDASVRLALVFMDGIMVVYDESSTEYRNRTREGLEQTESVVSAVIADVSGRDKAAGAGLQEAWDQVRGSMLGGGDFGEGQLQTGYDAKVHADFDTNMQHLRAEVERLYGLREKRATLGIRTQVLAANVISSYVKVAGAPFGAYTDSYNTEGADVESQVRELDALLGELRTRVKADKEKSGQLAGLLAKWQFIRTSILKSSTQSTPFIVYKHGGDIIRGLSAFR